MLRNYLENTAIGILYTSPLLVHGGNLLIFLGECECNISASTISVGRFNFSVKLFLKIFDQ